jgi:hypothetical protein
MRKSFLFSLLFLCVASSAAFAQKQPYTPERGGVERQAIMDALRVPVEKKLKKKAIFKVDHLKAQNGWAFMRGVPQMSDGSPMDYSDTVYKDAIDEGVFDDWICALFRKQGDKWKVVVYVIGATDVVYEGWDRKYKAPSAIFR